MFRNLFRRTNQELSDAKADQRVRDLITKLEDLTSEIVRGAAYQQELAAQPQPTVGERIVDVDYRSATGKHRGSNGRGPSAENEPDRSDSDT